MKRFILFIFTNLLVLLTLSIISQLLGINQWLVGTSINYTSLLIFCLFWGMGGAFISLYLSKFITKKMMGVKVVDMNGTNDEAHLVATVHRLAKKAGLSKMPEVGIYNSEEVNAFATGSSRNNSLVAVSHGLLKTMNDENLEGVLGHEIAHIANGDMVTMTLIQGVVNAFVMFLSRVVVFALSSFMNDEEEGGNFGIFEFVLVIILEIIFSILASPLIAWFSRQREYRADRGGALLSGKEKMIGALQTLRQTFDLQSDKTPSNVSVLQISNKPSKLLALFSTHPSLENRIQRLKNMK